MEKIQGRETKLILRDYLADYRSWLISILLLPLMYMYVYEFLSY